MNLLCDTAICQLDWQQYNSYPSLSILSFVSTLLSVGHFPTLMHIPPSTSVMILLKRMPLVWRSCWRLHLTPHKMAIENCQWWPQNGNRKLSVQNFIPQQASHHFVFCYRKVDWQIVEYALVLRMMAHLKFKFEPNENFSFKCRLGNR